MDQIFSVIITPLASSDLDEICDAIAENSIAAADRMHERILNRADGLSVFPFRGKRVEEPNVPQRIQYVAEGKYLIFYTVVQDKVLILRVLHGARDYLPLLLHLDTQHDND